MASVELQNVTKVFANDVRAVSNLTLKVADQELLVLVGPSGCGKSTTLRMIAGLEEATAGTLKIGERVVNDVPPKDRDVAMVFQNYSLYPHKTVYENLAFGLRLRRYPKAEIDRRVQEAARILDIGGLLERKPRELSGGERQRVAVGRAIVRKPAVFLFDEPLSNLDAKLRVEMRAEINRLHQRLATTMIYVTHDQVEAMTLGDRIAVMNEGVVQQLASPLHVYRKPTNMFVAGFIGTPAMNLLRGKLVSTNQGLWFEEETARLRLPEWIAKKVHEYVGREVMLGIRPEDLHNRQKQKSTAGNSLEMKVNVVEPVGNEIIVYLSAGKNELIGRFGTHRQVEVNEHVQVELNLDKSYVFDPASGKNLILDGDMSPK